MFIITLYLMGFKTLLWFSTNGKDWEYRDTIIAFPELTEEMIVELLMLKLP
jgi:hypothetical protein